ncbi:Plasma kallikrein [Pristimantis euphronides]
MTFYYTVTSLFLLIDLAYGDCVTELEHDVLLQGGDLGIVFAPDAEYCQMVCTFSPRCLMFSYLTASWPNDNERFACFLKDSATLTLQKVSIPGTISGRSLKHCTSRIHGETLSFATRNFVVKKKKKFEKYSESCKSIKETLLTSPHHSCSTGVSKTRSTVESCRAIRISGDQRRACNEAGSMKCNSRATRYTMCFTGVCLKNLFHRPHLGLRHLPNQSWYWVNPNLRSAGLWIAGGVLGAFSFLLTGRAMVLRIAPGLDVRISMPIACFRSFCVSIQTRSPSAVVTLRVSLRGGILSVLPQRAALEALAVPVPAGDVRLGRRVVPAPLQRVDLEALAGPVLAGDVRLGRRADRMAPAEVLEHLCWHCKPVRNHSNYDSFRS